jgi:aldose 1-epimerase
MLKVSNSQSNNINKFKSFGFLPNGTEVICYILSNENGFQCEVINFGATITSLIVPLSNNEKVDVVLGFEKIQDYNDSFHLPSAPYLGAIVGRYAGRINNAKFELNTEIIQLNKNHGEHSLHGGSSGFSMVFWEIISVSDISITLQYISNDNEENFPGQLTTQITYTLTEENELKVDMIAKSTEDTVVNLTQHSYFNLDGHSNDILNQKLFVNSSKVLETTTEDIPTGNFCETIESKFDFSFPKELQTKIDNTFVLNKRDDLAAILFSTKNKIKMSVYTNQPSVHIYIGGNCFNTIKGKENANYHSLSGICFETQNFPDAPNHIDFPSAFLKKGENYIHKSIYHFQLL